MPLTLNRTPITATNTTVTMPADLAKHRRPVGAGEGAEGPRLPQPSRVERSEHPTSPERASVVEPVTSMPIANSASPAPMTTGITSGRFNTRVRTSRITPKTTAGTQWASTAAGRRSPTARRETCMSAATPMPPFRSSHPVPARNPPTTGYGTYRTRLPSRTVPSTKNVMPVRIVTTRVAAMTVRNARWGLP